MAEHEGQGGRCTPRGVGAGAAIGEATMEALAFRAGHGQSLAVRYLDGDTFGLFHRGCRRVRKTRIHRSGFAR